MHLPGARDVPVVVRSQVIQDIKPNVKKVQIKMSETSRRGYLELGDPIGWDTTLEHVIEEKLKIFSKNVFFR